MKTSLTSKGQFIFYQQHSELHLHPWRCTMASSVPLIENKGERYLQFQEELRVLQKTSSSIEFCRSNTPTLAFSVTQDERRGRGEKTIPSRCLIVVSPLAYHDGVLDFRESPCLSRRPINQVRESLLQAIQLPLFVLYCNDNPGI